jgi:hypothetical protein
MFNNLTSRRILLQAAAAIVIPATARADQGKMDRALASLENALQSLREATPNKGGHKETSVQLIEQAIAEVNAGIRFADEHGVRPYRLPRTPFGIPRQLDPVLRQSQP